MSVCHREAWPQGSTLCCDGDGPSEDVDGPSEDRGGPSEDGGGPSEDGGGPSEDGGGPSEDRGGPSEDGGGPSEDGGGPSEDGGGPSEDRGGPSEDGGGPSEDGGGPSEDRGGSSQDRGGPSELRQCDSALLHLLHLTRERLCDIIQELLEVPADLKRIKMRKRRVERAAVVASAVGLLAGAAAIPFTHGYSSAVSVVAVVTGIATVIGVHTKHNKETRRRRQKLRTLGAEFMTAAAALKERLDGLDAALTDITDSAVSDFQTELRTSTRLFDRLTADVTDGSVLIHTNHFNEALAAVDKLRPILEKLQRHVNPATVKTT